MSGCVSGRAGRWVRVLAAAGLAAVLSSAGRAAAQNSEEEIDDISGEYHFLAADDTLGLLEQEGELKGYIEVMQGEDESDAVLSYSITIGSRKENRVEFRTNKIHQKYYRFSGTVARGSGHEEKDADYLRLTGGLETVTVKADSGEEVVDRRRVVFKRFGRDERAGD